MLRSFGRKPNCVVWTSRAMLYAKLIWTQPKLSCLDIQDNAISFGLNQINVFFVKTRFLVKTCFCFKKSCYLWFFFWWNHNFGVKSIFGENMFTFWWNMFFDENMFLIISCFLVKTCFILWKHVLFYENMFFGENVFHWLIFLLLLWKHVFRWKYVFGEQILFDKTFFIVKIGFL